MAKRLLIIHSSLLIMVGCVLSISSFNKHNLPRLSAEMSVYKHEERLRFEQKIKFSSRMISEIAGKLLKFCSAVCPKVNQDLVRRFTKKLTSLFYRCESTLEKEERLYIGYEKAFSNCLFSRYLRAFGFGTIMPEPEINIFTIKNCGKADILPKRTNVTVYPLKPIEKEDTCIFNLLKGGALLEEEEYIPWDEQDEVYFTKTNDYLGPYDLYSLGTIELFEEFYEKQGLPTFFNVSNSHFVEISNINRLISLFKIAVELYYEQCPTFYKPYATFWRKFISSLRHFLEQNQVNKYALILYFYFNGFEDELKKCAANKHILKDIFADSFEIGNVYTMQ